MPIGVIINDNVIFLAGIAGTLLGNKLLRSMKNG